MALNLSSINRLSSASLWPMVAWLRCLPLEQMVRGSISPICLHSESLYRCDIMTLVAGSSFPLSLRMKTDEPELMLLFSVMFIGNLVRPEVSWGPTLIDQITCVDLLSHNYEQPWSLWAISSFLVYRLLALVYRLCKQPRNCQAIFPHQAAVACLFFNQLGGSS